MKLLLSVSLLLSFFCNITMAGCKVNENKLNMDTLLDLPQHYSYGMTPFGRMDADKMHEVLESEEKVARYLQVQLEEFHCVSQLRYQQNKKMKFVFADKGMIEIVRDQSPSAVADEDKLIVQR